MAKHGEMNYGEIISQPALSAQDTPVLSSFKGKPLKYDHISLMVSISGCLAPAGLVILEYIMVGMHIKEMLYI